MWGDFFSVDVSMMDEPRKTIPNCAINYTRGLRMWLLIPGLRLRRKRGSCQTVQSGWHCGFIGLKFWFAILDTICQPARMHSLSYTGFWLALLFPSWIQVQFILLDPLTDHSSVPHELSIQTLKRCESFVSWVWADSFIFWVGSSDIVNSINLRGKFRLGLHMHNGLPKMKLTQCTQGGALAGFVRSPTQGPSPNPQPSI